MNLGSKFFINSFSFLMMFLLAPVAWSTPKEENKSTDLPPRVATGSHTHARLRHPNFVRVSIPYGILNLAELELAFGRTLNDRILFEAGGGHRTGMLHKRYKADIYRLGFRGAFFLNDSFYFSLGVDYQMFESALKGNPNTPIADNDFKASQRQVSNQWVIGSRWGRENFFFIVEWLRVTNPVARISETYVQNDKFSANTFELSRRANKEAAEATNLSPLNLSIGYAL
ncbi:MAG: hypothetical protein RLZZ488_2682 [Pseudomonadota bacterium]